MGAPAKSHWTALPWDAYNIAYGSEAKRPGHTPRRRAGDVKLSRMSDVRFASAAGKRLGIGSHEAVPVRAHRRRCVSGADDRTCA